MMGGWEKGLNGRVGRGHRRLGAGGEGTGGITCKEDGGREYWERQLELEGNLGARKKSNAMETPRNLLEWPQLRLIVIGDMELNV